jgi:hypothetical protein
VAEKGGPLPLRGLLLALLLLLAAPPLAAQEPEPLERFLVRVARLWAAGDASGIAQLAASDGRISVTLEREGASGAPVRHAAARLRALFSQRETIGATPVRSAVSGGSPLRGYGEIAWSFRVRGLSDRQTASVYVGVVSENGAWRIRELRLIQ